MTQDVDRGQMTSFTSNMNGQFLSHAENFNIRRCDLGIARKTANSKLFPCSAVVGHVNA